METLFVFGLVLMICIFSGALPVVWANKCFSMRLFILLSARMSPISHMVAITGAVRLPLGP